MANDDKDHNGDEVDFDKSMLEILRSQMETLQEAGLSPGESGDRLCSAFTVALRASAPHVAQAWIDTAPEMLAERRRLSRSYERRIQRHWGRALERFYAVAVVAEEAGSSFDQKRADEFDREDYHFEALTGIHALACRTAFEVHHLLSGGFPMGAVARGRTLHELAVTAIIIGDHGKPDGENPDLGERYLRHRGVLNWKDAQTYQVNAAHNGYTPFSDDEYTAIKDESDALVRRYGSNFRGPYGWAAGLFRHGKPKFFELEELADIAHRRGHCKWASHEVHADSTGAAHNIFEVQGGRFRAAGRMDIGLCDPGHMALISLQQCLLSVLFSPEDIAPSDMLCSMAQQQLVDAAGDEFLRAHEAVTASYKRGERIWRPKSPDSGEAV